MLLMGAMLALGGAPSDVQLDAGSVPVRKTLSASISRRALGLSIVNASLR